VSSWVESTSQHFTARHATEDEHDAGSVLELLEDARARLSTVFAATPANVAVVLHQSRTELDLAQPVLPIVRRITSPAARRYLAGWPGSGVLHVLAPRLLAERAANVEGSREMLLLTPAALYVQLVVAEANTRLPPPWSPRATVRATRCAWVMAGTAQWFSGQTAHARGAIARRLREGGRPAFPPSIRDAALLGGSVVDLLVRERGVEAAVTLARSPPDRPDELIAAFGGHDALEIEGRWRTHLAGLTGR
jgi:hypothetical protein